MTTEPEPWGMTTLFDRCPACGAWIDRQMHPEGLGPCPGDCSVCIRCGVVSVFGPSPALGLVLPSAEELAALLATETGPEIRRVIEAIRRSWAKFPDARRSPTRPGVKPPRRPRR